MSFGIPYLFLSPEYLNEVGTVSYFILGFAIGGFIMAFHLYSYLILGPSFPFIASLGRPFYKFCINNSTIPILFLSILIYNIYKLEHFEDLKEVNEILIYIVSLLLGTLAFLIIAMFYFRLTNKNSDKYNRSKDKLVKSFFMKPSTYLPFDVAKKYKPKFYLKSFFQIKATRNIEHYDAEMFESVLKQNQFNASLFEIIVVLSFIGIGLFSESNIFVIPAAASIMLLFTLLLMIFSIIYSWLRKWTTVVIVCLAILLNYISKKTDSLSIKSYAYGLDYTHNEPYSLNKIKALQFNDSILKNDIARHKAILVKWKQKASKVQHLEKPKLIIVNASGGGLRAALWTFNVLQKLNAAFDGKFMRSTHLMTGASGGMLGTAYFRELFNQSNGVAEKLNDTSFIKNMGNDLLNSVSFDLVTNDLFLRRKQHNFNGVKYNADRGLAFENDLNENTSGVLLKTLLDYEKDERTSKIPLIVLSPTIVNDGRRLIIGTQPYAFLNGTNFENKDIGPENVELLKLFKNNNAMGLSFITALRMNATFPYVLPMINLPTSPEIVAMDAGIRDNYGIKTTVRYIKAFEKWFLENTSGIILVEIRDISKDYNLDSSKTISFFNRLTQPIGNFYGNYLHAQEYSASELFDFANSSRLKIDKISFLLRKSPQDKISLSWHLTEIEKNKIKNTFENSRNQKELLKLIHLLR